jgi:hypothetical protein
MILRYENISGNVFWGFYESPFNSSDDPKFTIFGGDKIPDGFEPVITDFDGYCREMGQYWADEFWAELPVGDPVIKNVEFVGIVSPRFYNFTTDKIVMDVKIYTRQLRKYCLVTNREEFGDYLRENFTTRSGFISFVPNNVPDFEDEMAVEKIRCYRIMLEFYMERVVDLEAVNDHTAENKYEIMDKYIAFEGQDGKLYDYEYVDGELKIGAERKSL